MLEINVRDATPDDAAGIARVRTLTWRSAYAHIFSAEQLASISEERGAEWWRGVLADPPPRTHTLVVDGAEGVVGFASVGSARGDLEDSSGVGELYAIYVFPDASGRGVGQALMVEALGRFSAEGFREAILWVLEDNPRTRHFYELAGWRADGVSKDEEWLGTTVREVRYRITLEPTPRG